MVALAHLGLEPRTDTLRHIAQLLKTLAASRDPRVEPEDDGEGERYSQRRRGLMPVASPLSAQSIAVGWNKTTPLALS
jgi:hypothetical protein